MSDSEIAPEITALGAEMETIGVDQMDGELVVLERGDRRIRWKRGTKSEEEARKEFERLRAQGRSVFKMDSDGKKGVAIDTFDELLDSDRAVSGSPTRAMVVPQMRGG